MTEERQRTDMVDRQIARRGITDQRVLEAMRTVPRHLFVPAANRHQAYDDRALPIAEGQTISQPFIVALMTSTLELRPGDRVLEVGTGSGYQTAVLAHLGAHVLSIERHAGLAAAASGVLAGMGLSGIEIVVGDGTEGWPPGAPYDRILVTAGAPAVPGRLTEQLVDGGRLVIPVGPPGLQHLTVVDRVGHDLRIHKGEACVFVPLIGAGGWPEEKMR
jgi:protein-L-isoaspartate(D-aspartate) O-methyltransferase